MTTSAPNTELYAWVRLSLEPNLSSALARLLLANFGLPQHIYAQSISTLSRYVPTSLAVQIHASADPDLEQRIQASLAWKELNANHHLLCLADHSYPTALLNLHDPPLMLYAKGDLSQLDHPALAIVGARSATTAGNDNAYHFAQFLSTKGWCIVSGLASGIDTAAHQGALAAATANSTIAVLGTGMDLVYPARNRDLAHQIADKGLLLTEFPLGAKALPYHFLLRNRLVAALSKGVLVVEAALKSGSLTTARLATEIGKEVFAIPGSIHSPLHKGCHQLIRNGAKLVESAEHILEELKVAPRHIATHQDIPAAPTLKTIPQDLELDLKHVLDVMGYDEISPDQLQQRSNLNTAQLGAALVQLELFELITQQRDGRYIRS